MADIAMTNSSDNESGIEEDDTSIYDISEQSSTSANKKSVAANNFKMLLEQKKNDWDVDFLPEGAGTPDGFCLNRIKKDLFDIFKKPLPLIFVVPDEDDITRIHAVISGPQSTPYEGGFFYFVVKMTSDYPMLPPRVKLITTAGGTVRFNPNLYKSGKVCLSIIGTWPGPQWTAAHSLQSLLLSIQSLLNENPYSNEPGFNHLDNPLDSKLYNEYICHETLRVAVCDMAEGRVKMPPPLLEMVQSAFLQYTGFYEEVIAANKTSDNTKMYSPYRENVGKFNYSQIGERLEIIKKTLQRKLEITTTTNENMS